ncbi:MAG: serine/threonine-protein phosphatase, partial [Clostridiales bacterium]|nr:serine/threonine-protein phosphatase [Clostridiales bacterium]
FHYLKSRPGFVLAGMEGIRYRKNELRLSPGDTVFLYTDGITEATDGQMQLYGEERLRTVVNRGRMTPEELCAAVKADVDTFVGGAPQFDDITMLALTYKGDGAEPHEKSEDAVCAL